MEIGAYSFGAVVIDGKTYRRDLIVLPGAVRQNWRRRHGHRLALADLGDALSCRPRTLVIGTGASGRMEVPAPLIDLLAARGIATAALPTPAAFERFALILGRQEQVASAFHLTC